jgi:hypothetical protein
MIRNSSEAAAEFRRHVKGKNIMTPETVEYVRIGDWAVEVATGTGFDYEPIWGVSVLVDGKIDGSLGGLFWSWDDVEAHLVKLDDGTIFEGLV